MFHLIITLSLIITGIFIVFQQGMFLGWLRIIVANWIDRVAGDKMSKYIQKPLWDCLPCMSGLWVIVITRSFDIVLILAVCGLNAVIAKTLDYETSVGG